MFLLTFKVNKYFFSDFFYIYAHYVFLLLFTNYKPNKDSRTIKLLNKYCFCLDISNVINGEY